MTNYSKKYKRDEKNVSQKPCYTGGPCNIGSCYIEGLLYIIYNIPLNLGFYLNPLFTGNYDLLNKLYKHFPRK